MVKTPTLLDLTIILVLCGVLLDILNIEFDADGTSVKRTHPIQATFDTVHCS